MILTDDANAANQETNDCTSKQNTHAVVTSTTYCCDTDDSGLEGTLDGATSLLDDGDRELANNNHLNEQTPAKYSINGDVDERIELEFTHKPDHQVVTVHSASALEDLPTKRHLLGTPCAVHDAHRLSFPFCFQ